MKKLLVLLVACLALTLAACGDDDDDGDSGGGGSTPPAETTEESTPPSGAAGSEKVDIPSISFEPASLTIKAGTTVTWTNSDDLPHTVTKTDGPGPEFDSGNLDPGSGQFEQTFEAKGKIDYVCTIHPGQAGSVTVK
jgi:plastocyanin